MGVSAARTAVQTAATCACCKLFYSVHRLLLSAISALQVLSLHAVPSAALNSTQLTDGQQLTAVLANATALIVSLVNGSVKIATNASEPENAATVVNTDAMAGGSVIHVIDRLLVPSSLLLFPTP
jgi:uncharacterized surface protein with fasciclin (FAS1) repeats